MHPTCVSATRLLAGLSLCLLVALGAVAISACGRSDAELPIQQRKPADKVYTTRAVVESLPDPNRPTAQFIVHHEAIDEFVNPDGTRGMNAMSMPMNVAPGVPMGDLKVGDKIELDLSVWNSDDGKRIVFYQATRIKALPADTELKFQRAAPTLGGPPQPAPARP